MGEKRRDMRIIGLDLGTSSIKALRFELSDVPPSRGAEGGRADRRARIEATAHRPHSLDTPQPGRAEQDAEAALKLSREVLDEVLTDDTGAIGVSGAMHGLMGLKGKRPLHAAWTWADGRSSAQARTLKRDLPGLAERTGTPIHPMAWPSKLLWMRENESELWNGFEKLVGIPEYVVAALAGAEASLSRSMASATGIWSHETLDWDEKALAYLKLSADRLPDVVASDAVAGKYRGVPVLWPSGDGPLSNLGTGSHRAGAACLSVGTSGAIRVAHQGPRSYPEGRTFCYHVVDDLWVSGGAISNGTVAMEWLRKLLGNPPLEELLGEAWATPPGGDGLIFLPYLAGERAPHWDVDARAKLVGLSLHHGRGHMARAVAEGVCLALRDVLESLPSGMVSEIRACGGFTHSAEWVQTLADVLGFPVSLVDGAEAGALGAAIVATRAVEPGSKLDPWLDAIEVGRSFKPTPDRNYDEIFKTYRSLYAPGS